jgi:glycerol-3-phosphate dehydrogenase subunit B
MARVVVIGGGIAGTAAAVRAARGATTTLVCAGAGASALAGGAIDDVAWEEVVRAARIAGAALVARPLAEDVLEFAEALDLWRLPAAGVALPQLCSLSGRIRPARGHDRGLLDLARVEPGVIAVPRVDRAAWDADSLVAAWNDDPCARRRGLVFRAIDAELLRFDGEARISDADLAARHDDPDRIAWLAARLREALRRASLRPSAVVLGPWLGVDAPRAAALSDRLDLLAGEALASVGSPAGTRFVRARDRLLARSNVTVVSGRVTRVAAPDADHERHRVLVEGAADPLRADRLVIACGGLAAGGIVYDPPDIHAAADMPDSDAPAFALSFEIDRTDGRPYLALGGARVGVASSMFGPDLDLTAWPSPGRPGALESIGVACDADGLAAPRIAAAGDAVADRPRTALVAVQSGLHAGDWAAGQLRQP